MASASMITISLTHRGKKIAALPATVSTYQGAPTSELLSILSKKTTLSQSRLRITDASTGAVLSPRDTLSHDTALTVKDLGPQLGWRTVYIIEYLGPLLIHPLVFTLLPNAKSSSQYVTLLMVTLHFLKREYETVFVHRFSADTMPAFNLLKNCAYYWFVGGLSLAAVTYSKWYSTETHTLPKVAIFVYVLSELCNFKTHTTLRDLRPAGSTTRKIPRGLGFNLVSCPNYLFEIVAWMAMSSVTNSFASWAFTLVGATQMWFWAVKRHRRYRKEFPEYPKDRKILIPYLL